MVKTDDGSLTVVHPGHKECFHSRSGALSEAIELYVNKSGIEGSFQNGTPVRVLDVGLGLGYNATATFAAWRRSPQKSILEITSLEIDAELVELFRSGVAPWQSNWTPEWLEFARGKNPGCKHEIFVGDAATANLGTAPFNFIWQDPFSPAKNPTMWSREWFGLCRAVAAPDCVLVTYSVARSVREALTEAGWVPEKVEAVGSQKRHWLIARPNTI